MSKKDNEAMAAISKLIGVPVEDLKNLSVIKVTDGKVEEVSTIKAAEEILGGETQSFADDAMEKARAAVRESYDANPSLQKAEEIMDRLDAMGKTLPPENPCEDVKGSEDYLMAWAEHTGFADAHGTELNAMTVAILAKRLVKAVDEENVDKIQDHTASIILHLMLLASAGGTSFAECFNFGVSELVAAQADTRSEVDKTIEKVKLLMDLIASGESKH